MLDGVTLQENVFADKLKFETGFGDEVEFDGVFGVAVIEYAGLYDCQSEIRLTLQAKQVTITKELGKETEMHRGMTHARTVKLIIHGYGDYKTIHKTVQIGTDYDDSTLRSLYKSVRNEMKIANDLNCAVLVDKTLNVMALRGYIDIINNMEMDELHIDD